MKLLIIEDEKLLSESMDIFLSKEGYVCVSAYTCGQAIAKIEQYDYDCILLDLMLPDGSGLKVLRVIKECAPETGVIIISAKNAMEDKVEGLKIGADDYIVKPFHLPELSMRIFALLRRRDFKNDNILQSGALQINLLEKHVSVGDTVLDLTKTEYELLLFLIKNQHRVLSKSTLAEYLNGDLADMMYDCGFVYAHIKNLKAKLAQCDFADCIKTYYGMGYQWIEK